MNKNDLNNNDLSFTELFEILISSKEFFLSISIGVGLLAFIASLFLNDIYRTEAILTQRDSSSQSGLMAQYSDVASLVGINLQNQNDGSINEMIEIIQSRAFVKHLISFDEILPSIMAASSYDREEREIRFKSSYDQKSKLWDRNPSNGRKIIPSYLEVHEKYLEMISISQDSNTGFINIRVDHLSPVFAKKFLNLIISEANSLKRLKDMQESLKALDYLKAQLPDTPQLEIRESINALIKQQLEVQMLTQINEEYALRTIEPPFEPEMKIKPVRILFLIIGFLIGAIISIIVILFRHTYSNKSIA